MRNNKWLLLAALVLVAGLVLTACAPQEVVVTVEVPGETVTVEVPVEAPVSEEPAGEAITFEPRDVPYRVGLISDITTTNYFGANGPDNTVWNSYTQPPRPTAIGQAERTFQLVPAAAVEVPAAAEGEGETWTQTVTFRQDVTWSDGTPVTANDWAWTASTVLKFQLFQGNFSNWYPSDYLVSIEATDDYTAVVTYNQEPGLAVSYYGVLQSPILPSHFWAPLVDPIAEGLPEEPTADELAAAQTALFTVDATGEPQAGPWVDLTWEPGAFAEVTHNESYYDAGTVITQFTNGAYQEARANGETFVTGGDATGDVAVEYTVGPFVASAVYTVYGSQDAAILALKDGEIDFILNSLGLQRGLLDQVEGDPNITVITNPTNGMRYLGFNHRRAPMSDTAFRQAVATVVDKPFITGNILQGVANPLEVWVPEANTAWSNPDVPRWGYNEDGTPMDKETRLNTAVQILTDAGYTWEGGTPPTWNADDRSVVVGGNLILPDGTPCPDLQILGLSPGYDPLRATFSIWIESSLRELGVPVTARLVGFNTIIAEVVNYTDETVNEWDMYTLGWSLSIFPDYLYDFFSAEQSVSGGNNPGGFSNEEFEALASQLKTCTTFEECQAIAFEVQMVLSNELPYILLFETGIIEAYANSTTAFPYTETLSGLQFGGHSVSDNVAVR